MRIYVAGPYTAVCQQEIVANVQKAIEAGVALLQAGHEPFVPHHSYWLDWHTVVHGSALPYERWMQWALTWVLQCEALLKIGDSPGADREEALARERGIPVYRSLEEIPACVPKTAELSTHGGRLK